MWGGGNTAVLPSKNTSFPRRPPGRLSLQPELFGARPRRGSRCRLPSAERGRCAGAKERSHLRQPRRRPPSSAEPGRCIPRLPAPAGSNPPPRTHTHGPREAAPASRAEARPPPAVRRARLPRRPAGRTSADGRLRGSGAARRRPPRPRAAAATPTTMPTPPRPGGPSRRERGRGPSAAALAESPAWVRRAAG